MRSKSSSLAVPTAQKRPTKVSVHNEKPFRQNLEMKRVRVKPIIKGESLTPKTYGGDIVNANKTQKSKKQTKIKKTQKKNKNEIKLKNGGIGKNNTMKNTKTKHEGKDDALIKRVVWALNLENVRMFHHSDVVAQSKGDGSGKTNMSSGTLNKVVRGEVKGILVERKYKIKTNLTKLSRASALQSNVDWSEAKCDEARESRMVVNATQVGEMKVTRCGRNNYRGRGRGGRYRGRGRGRGVHAKKLLTKQIEEIEMDSKFFNDSLYKDLGDFFTLNFMNMDKLHGQTETFKLKVTDTTLEVNGDEILIELVDVIFDGGSNTNLVKQSDYKLENITVIQRKISPFNGKTEVYELNKGELGDLKTALSMIDGGGKNIIVPSHARLLWKGCISFWIVIESLKTQLCILHMSEEIRKKFGMNTNGVVVAIVSPITNFIEMWTRKGLDLLNIHSDKTVDPYVIKIPVRCLREAVGDINTMKEVTSSNEGKLAEELDEMEVHAVDVLEELDEIDLEINVVQQSLNTFNQEIKHYADRNDECELKGLELNALEQLEQENGGSKDETLEYIINTCNMSDRYSLQTLQILRVMCGGRTISTLRNWFKNGTMQGLENIKDDEWTKAVIDYCHAKSAFTRAPRIPKYRRISFSVITRPGQQIQIDFIYFHTVDAGGKKTNAVSGKGFKGGLLAVCAATGRPWFKKLKSQKVKGYKAAFRGLLREIRTDMANAVNATTIESIIWDQHATQKGDTMREVINELNMKHQELDITVDDARLNKNDLAVLNRVSAIIHQNTTFFLMWSGLSTYFIAYAYIHAVRLYYYMPNVSSKKRGIGYSPFTLWNGVAVSTAMLPIPWGVSAIVHARVSGKVGGVDVIYMGIEGNECLYFSPLQSRMLRRAEAVHFIMQPGPNRLNNILMRNPIFKEDTLCTYDPKFNITRIAGIVWVKDTDQTRTTYGKIYGVADERRHGTKSTNVGYKPKAIRCTCLRQFDLLSSWRNHVNSALNDKNHVSLVVPPNQKEMNERQKIRLGRVKSDYNEKIMEQMQNKFGKDESSLSYSIGNQIRTTSDREITSEKVDEAVKRADLLIANKAILKLKEKEAEIEAKEEKYKQLIEMLKRKQQSRTQNNKHGKKQDNDVEYEGESKDSEVRTTDQRIEPSTTLLLPSETTDDENEAGESKDPEVYTTGQKIEPLATSLLPSESTCKEKELSVKPAKIQGDKTRKTMEKVQSIGAEGETKGETKIKSISGVNQSHKSKNKGSQSITQKKKRKLEKIKKKVDRAKAKAAKEESELIRNVGKLVKRINKYGREIKSTRRLIESCNNVDTKDMEGKCMKTKIKCTGKSYDINDDDFECKHVVNHLETGFESSDMIGGEMKTNGDEKGCGWMNDSDTLSVNFVEALEKYEILESLDENEFTHGMKKEMAEEENRDVEQQKFWETDDLDEARVKTQLNEMVEKLNINSMDMFHENINKGSVMEHIIRQEMPDFLNEANIEINVCHQNAVNTTPIITEKTFEKGTYKNELPSIIPSFAHVSMDELIRSRLPKWKNESGYDGSDINNFDEPLSEINQCLVKLDPAVITGLKHMSMGEREELRKKLTAANRRDYIPKNAWKALEGVFAHDFVDAMSKEFASISKLGVITVAEVPADKVNEVITCKCVFDIKWDDTLNKISKFKCRMVAQGFLQREWNEATGRGNYDSKSCSSPVLKSTSLKGMLSVGGATPNTGVMMNDIGTAFLCAKLKVDGSEDIYIALPDCCIVENNGIRLKPEIVGWRNVLNKTTGKRDKKHNRPRTIVKLVKALYGLRNASSAFYNTVVKFLTKHESMQKFEWRVSEEDPCLFLSNTGMGSIMTGIHVDDLISMGSHDVNIKGSDTYIKNGTNSFVLKEFNRLLHKHFISIGSTVKTTFANADVGVQFLGTVIKREDDGTITMSVEEKIKVACERLGLDLKYPGPATPYASGDNHVWRKESSIPRGEIEIKRTIKQVQELHKNQSIKTYEDVVRCYRAYTGNGIWFAETAAPYIMPTVYTLARFQTFPGIEHFHAIIRVFKYMYEHRERKLVFGKQRIDHQNPLITSRKALVIFTDTSHGDCPITRKATGGYVILLFGSLLLIRSFRLSCVTTSTAQSEYYMMSAASAESIYIMELYNKNFLPFINTAIAPLESQVSDMNKVMLPQVRRMPVLVSTLADETIDTLNAKNYPMISEQNKMMLYGDNASALIMAQNGPSKNSKHSMIHASWLWECYHIRKIISTHKVHTKCNPADICTKLGISAETFEKHVKTIMGENDTMSVSINNVAVSYIMKVEGVPEMITIIKDKATGRRVGVRYGLH